MTPDEDGALWKTFLIEDHTPNWVKIPCLPNRNGTNVNDDITAT